MRKILFVFICTWLSLTVSAQQILSEVPSAKKIEVEYLQKRISRKIQLIDVRTPKEFNEECIGNAVNIDYNAADFEANVKKLNKNKRVYIYCRTGNRSAKAADKMKALGFRKLYVLPTGMEGWKKHISIAN